MAWRTDRSPVRHAVAVGPPLIAAIGFLLLRRPGIFIDGRNERCLPYQKNPPGGGASMNLKKVANIACGTGVALVGLTWPRR